MQCEKSVPYRGLKYWFHPGAQRSSPSRPDHLIMTYSYFYPNDCWSDSSILQSWYKPIVIHTNLSYPPPTNPQIKTYWYFLTKTEESTLRVRLTGWSPFKDLPNVLKLLIISLCKNCNKGHCWTLRQVGCASGVDIRNSTPSFSWPDSHSLVYVYVCQVTMLHPSIILHKHTIRSIAVYDHILFQPSASITNTLLLFRPCHSCT